MVTDVSEEQRLKAPVPIDVAAGGMTIDVSDEHAQQRFCGTVIRAVPRLSELREVHERKAAVPTTVTEFGRLIDVRDEQDRNAESPMERSELPSKLAVVRNSEFAKAEKPIEVTEAGIRTERRGAQNQKAFAGIPSHVLGISTCPRRSGVIAQPASSIPWFCRLRFP